MDGLNRRQLVLASLGLAALGCTSRRPQPPAAGSPPPPVAPTAPPAGGDTTLLTSRGAAGQATFVRQGPAGSRGVALTFHVSGPIDAVRPLFEEARRLQTPLTLFLVGSFVTANPAFVASLPADGHELANHTANHRPMGRLTPSEVASEIRGCREAIQAAAGDPGRWFRPSGLEVPTPAVLDAAGSAGYPRVVGYDIDPVDYKDPGAASVAERVKARLHPGAIVSLHTAHAGTVAAFADIVAAVRGAGLEPQTTSALLG